MHRWLLSGDVPWISPANDIDFQLHIGLRLWGKGWRLGWRGGDGLAGLVEADAAAVGGEFPGKVEGAAVLVVAMNPGDGVDLHLAGVEFRHFIQAGWADGTRFVAAPPD